MKITLIYPGIVRIGFNSLGKGGMNRNWINLGLAYIGAYFKQNSYDVDLIDLREMSGWSQVEQDIKVRDSDVCGIHFNTVNYNNGLKCAQIAKRNNKVVVAGGPHATISSAELLATGFVDYVIIGEGEISFLKLAKDIEKDKASERIIVGEKIENLDSIPFPDRDLYNISKVTGPLGSFPYLDNGMVIMASRGCPYRCTFCQPFQRKMFGDKIRQRSVENVIAEVKEVIEKYRVKYISFQDDTFTLKKSWVLELCRRMKEENIRIQWSTQSRVNTFDEDLAKEMKDAGCVCLFFGFESGSQRILDFLKKDITVKQSLNAAKLCREFGILIFADYMLGIPTETEKELEETYQMIKKIRPERHSPTYFVPIPGSYLYEYCRDRNLLKISSYEDFTRNPFGEKIEVIDYQILERYKRKMLRETTCWWEEISYTKMALERWTNLWKGGYRKKTLIEFCV
jgi:anaerobic magnesium-protoporphyrin IX monomethyl ester cyclase